MLMLLKNAQFYCGKRTLALIAFFGILASGPLRADMILIQFEDFDIGYDGTDIFDADPGLSDPDPVTNTSFSLDGVPVTTFATGVTADLLIPDVIDIEVGPGTSTVISGIDGILDLDFGGGMFLDLDLDSVAIIYVDASVFQFVFGATVATVSDQELPDGLYLGDPISVSFETSVDSDSLSDDGDFLLGFTAVGTGTILGEHTVDPTTLPEPATLALALFGLIGISLGSFISQGAR